MVRLVMIAVALADLRHLQIQTDGSVRWLPSVNQTLESPHEALNLAKVSDLYSLLVRSIRSYCISRMLAGTPRSHAISFAGPG